MASFSGLYPPEAVCLAWKLVELVKQNAKAFQKELHCLEEDGYTETKGPYPCPYLAATLFQCVQDFDGGRWDAEQEGIVDNCPRQHYNHTGFTVIDVTDPFRPAYCFVNYSGYDEYGFPAGYPMDLVRYALHYCPDDKLRSLADLEPNVQKAIQGLKSVPMIRNRAVLDEAWNAWPDRKLEEDFPSPGDQEFMERLRSILEMGDS
ncbi:hypothetical protein FRB90_010685 [Tulasnella sp. 427]|nr:hypothetical protein FRB90_010685 [Tulasnella sp. 427]